MAKSGFESGVGFIGLGNMGAPVAARLSSIASPISVHDVRGDVVAAFTKVHSETTVARSPQEIASACQVVVLMVPNSDAVENVVYGSLIDSLKPGSILVDMGSSEPLRTAAVASTLEKRGSALVDAPVSGGVSGARNGTLTIMVGGEPDKVQTVWPLLEALGSRVYHVGPSGAGHALKALNNYLSAAHLLATSEAILVGKRFGLEPRVMLDVINGSSGRSGSSENKWPNYILPGTFASGFGLGLMVKDLHIAEGLVEAAQQRGGIVKAVMAAWDQAASELASLADHTEIARWLEAQLPESA